jgi:hypothetical protein
MDVALFWFSQPADQQKVRDMVEFVPQYQYRVRGRFNLQYTPSDRWGWHGVGMSVDVVVVAASEEEAADAVRRMYTYLYTDSVEGWASKSSWLNDGPVVEKVEQPVV